MSGIPPIAGAATAVVVRFEMASRAICRAEPPDFPATKKGEAAQQAHVDANWASQLSGVTAGYDRWEQMQTRGAEAPGQTI